MRLLTCLLSGCLTLGLAPAAAQDPAPGSPPAPGAPATIELVEDLRILSILNVLQPTRDQSTKLAAVALAGKEGLADIEADAKGRLDQQRERLLAARQQLLRGGVASSATDLQLASASQAAQSVRTQKTESLILAMAARVRRLLTPEQAHLVEDELAPTADQPWRRYARVLGGPAAGRTGGRMPADPGRWLNELRDLRVDSAEGDPGYEVQDFARKLTRGLPSTAPHYEESIAQGRAFATQVLAMPEDLFKQREWDLAKLAAKQELETRNRQRTLEGKALEIFDPARWLVEEVMLSPRAETDLRDRAAAR